MLRTIEHSRTSPTKLRAHYVLYNKKIRNLPVVLTYPRSIYVSSFHLIRPPNLYQYHKILHVETAHKVRAIHQPELLKILYSDVIFGFHKQLVFMQELLMQLHMLTGVKNLFSVVPKKYRSNG